MVKKDLIKHILAFCAKLHFKITIKMVLKTLMSGEEVWRVHVELVKFFSHKKRPRMVRLTCSGADRGCM